MLLGIVCVSAFQGRAQIDVDHVLIMGRAAVASDDYLTAIRYFSQVIEARPRQHKAYYYRAYAKFCLDDILGATADCSSAIEINPFQAAPYQLRGICWIRSERYDSAAVDYTRVLLDAPDDVPTRFNRGLCYLELKDYVAARADMDDILRRSPRYVKAYSVQAEISMGEGDTVAGIRWLNDLLAINRENAAAWSFLGHYALQHDRYTEADSLLSQAVRFQPKSYNDYLGRAIARNAMNRFASAISDYDAVISIIPEHFVAHYNRALVLALVGENNRAIDDFSFVLRVEPDNVLARYNRALLRQETGDFAGAAADYTVLLRAYPSFIYGYSARAECRRKLGQIHGAIQDETVVARANLDLTFNQRRRRPMKKVRRGSDHAFDHYDQLVGEETDSLGSPLSRLLAGDLFGRVQNKHADKTLLPMFVLTRHRPPSEKGHDNAAFLPELSAYNARVPSDARLYFTAITTAATSDEETDAQGRDVSASTFAAHQRRHATVHSLSASDSVIHRAATQLDAYDYQGVLETLTDENQDKLREDARVLSLFLRAAARAHLSTLHQSTLMGEAEAPVAEVGAKAKQPTVLSQPNAPSSSRLPLIDLQSILKLSSSRAYAYYNIGCIIAADGDSAGAIHQFTLALNEDSRFAEAYFNRGLLRLDTGDVDGAKADLSRAGELGLYRAYSLLKLAK